MTITRRSLLMRLAGAIPATAIATRASPQVLFQALAGLPPASNGSFFDSGRQSGTAPTIISSNEPNKGTTLAGVFGQSPSAFFTFTYRALLEPVNTMPVIVVNDPLIGDIFRVELWPDQVLQYWDSLTSRWKSGYLPGPTGQRALLRTLFAASVAGSYRYNSYITTLPRYAAGVQSMIRLFYNYNGPAAPVSGAVPAPGFSNFAVLYNNLGDGAAINVQASYYLGSGSAGGPGPGPQVFPVNWGTTFGWQPDIHIGGDPNTLTPDYTFHGILDSLNLVTGPNIPAPIDTVNLINQDTGAFRRLPPGGFGSGGISPVNLSGPPSYNGIGFNLGPYFLVPGSDIPLDTTFGTRFGGSEPQLPPPGTDILYEDDSVQ